MCHTTIAVEGSIDVREVERRAADAYRAQFGTRPDLVTSAPGRVNLIGEHTDYNGGFVLPCAIDQRIAVAVAPGGGNLYSTDFDNLQTLNGCRNDGWADYPRGVTWALTDRGYDIPAYQAAFAGDVPVGSGLSSSAAIEAATALALDTLFHLDLGRKDLARLCQRAENVFVGVNSGIMDQYASLLCREGEALLIDCRSLEAEGVPLDLQGAGLTLLVCDTRVERSLAATGYNERRATCERAARILGVPQLRDARPEDLTQLTGLEVKRARHVVTEDGRVLAAVKALQGNGFAAFGRLMYASHASLRDDFEVSTPELNTFVETAREVGALGARLTGAGFGGAAIALIATEQAGKLQDAACAQFQRNGFKEPVFYRFYPSPGAEVAA
jgi:galactokinase